MCNELHVNFDLYIGQTHRKSHIMKKYLSFFVFISIFITGYSQLIIAPNPTGTYAVQDVLVGQGVTASNIQYTGVNHAWATFSTGATPTSLGFTHGVLLTTGRADEVNRNACNSDGTLFGATVNRISTTNIPGAGSDPQLAAIATGSVNDRCVLEFDFIPINDTLKFRYVFGSEEYPDYVNGTVNDIFGFFISGPNPAGGTYTNRNIAIIPGTNLPVAINNVNNGNTANNAIPNGPCMNCQYYIHNNNGTAANSNPHIAYDGMTTVLTAIVAVVPCQTYHIKLAIGDVGDRIYDSGVFIEANSFSSMGMSYDLNFESDIIANTIISGCSDASLVFRLPEQYGDTVTINYSFAGAPVQGVDYLVFPADSAIIPPGQDSVVVQIIALPNSQFNGTDTIMIIIPGFGCSGNVDTLYIPIHGNPPIELTMSEDQMLCDGGTGFLTPTVQGGLPPLTYTWSNGVTNLQQDVIPPVTTTYILTVTDPCGNNAIDSVKVTIGSLLHTASNDTAICSGKAVTLSATFDGLIYWEGYEGNPLTVLPNQTTTYKLIMNNVCGTVYDSVHVVVHQQPQVSLGAGGEICNYENRILEVSPNYETIEWYHNGAFLGNMPQVVADTNIGSGNYFVRVSNSFCKDSASITIIFIPCEITIPNVFTPNGDGVNDYFFIDNLINYPFSNLEIYNRWGRKVYSTNNYQNDWDGSGLADGVYYYVLTLMQKAQQVGFEGWNQNFAGSVTIIR